jgi:hypothetical protein
MYWYDRVSVVNKKFFPPEFYITAGLVDLKVKSRLMGRGW